MIEKEIFLPHPWPFKLISHEGELKTPTWEGKLKPNARQPKQSPTDGMEDALM